MTAKPCFRGPLDREHGKSVEIMFQSEWRDLYKIYESLWRKLHWKKSLLVIHEILRQFVDTLTVDEKHYLLKTDNLTQPIQIQLSQKEKSFAVFFFLHFQNLKKILNIFQKRTILKADVFREIPLTKNMVRSMSKKPCFRGPLDRKYGIYAETLLRYEWQHL